MRKLLLIGALVAILVLPTVVFAESKSVEVSYTVNPGYTLTIPAELRLVTTNPIPKVVSVTDVRIASNEILTVTMESKNFTGDSKNGYHVKYDGDSIIPYTVKMGETTADTKVSRNNIELISIVSGVESKSLYMTFSTTDKDVANSTKAGKHVDTLTFTAEVSVRK